MAKFLVRCYYEYSATIVVEANDANEAFDIAWEQAEKMTTDELDYVGYVNSEVHPINENGKVDYDTIYEVG